QARAIRLRGRGGRGPGHAADLVRRAAGAEPRADFPGAAGRPMKPRSELPGLAPLLVLLATASMALLIVMPLGMVFAEAFRNGIAGYLEPLREPDAWAAIRLTLLVAAIS